MRYILFTLVLFCSTLLYADNWPREVMSSEGLITMYQPQIDSYSGSSLKARAAVSIIQTGKNELIFGAIWVNCRVFTDRPTRTVMLEDMEVRRIKFPSGTGTDTAEIAAALEEMIPRFDLTFSLDLLLLSVEAVQKERESARELEMKPPKIVIIDRPAVLVRIDGDPILSKVAGTSLKRIINTPYFLVQNTISRKYFLHGGDFWFSSNTIKGRWYKVSTPPRSVTNLYEKMKFDEEIDEDMTDDAVFFLKTQRVPEIFVATEPTELISTEGPIRLAPIQGTGLFYASNTPNRLFFENSTQHYFILASGRWYRSNKIDGPWTFTASDRLPIDFKRIPPGSACDDILAHVAGTIPAKEAIYDSQIPQMAEVDRYQTTQVDYDGDPQFESIENTGMEYAVNTSIAVIRVNEHFYGCDRGIWFQSHSPFGPWGICIDVPEIIYTIPPRCPIYNVRYVRVYTYTPDVVYFGYTAGYTGCYVYSGTVVYGTGYNYRPWHKHSYYARPWTWGFNVHYDPWIGWSISAGWTRPHGWFVRQPEIKHAGWWGPGENHPGYRPVSKPVYRDGYQPAYRPEIANVPVKETSKNIRRNSGIQRSTTLYDSRGTSIRRPVTSEPVNASRTVTREIPTTTSTEVSPISRPTTSPITQPEQSRPTRESARTTRETTRTTAPIAQPESSRSTREVTRTTPQPAPETSPIIKPTPPVEPQRVSRTTSRTGQRIVTQPSIKDNNVFAAPDGSILRSTPEGWQQRDQNTWKNATEAPTRQATVRDSEVRQRAAERTANPRTQTSPQSVPKSDTEKDVRRR